MNSLSANEQSFINMMKESPEDAATGYRLLAKRPEKAKRFFPFLIEADFLVRQEVPHPVAVQGGYQLPYWAGLDYLLALTKTDLNADPAFARQLRDLVRGLSDFEKANTDKEEFCTVFDNYHTFRRFAEILGCLPLEVIEEKDIRNSLRWISGRFDRSLVASCLANGLLENLIEGGENYNKYVLLFIEKFTKLSHSDQASQLHRDRWQTAVEGYWLDRILDKVVPSAVRAVGMNLVDLLIRRSTDFIVKDSPNVPSFMPRPAIEDHEQNHSWRKTGNALIDAARDSLLLSVSEFSENTTSLTLLNLLRSAEDLQRRLAIHAFDEEFDKTGGIPIEELSDKLFDRTTYHEFHRYLSNRFALHSKHWQDKVVEIIEAFKEEDGDDENVLQHRRLRWLTAICPGGSQRANDLYQKILDEYQLGIPKNPDFLLYMDTGWVTDSSPYAADELVEALEAGNLTRLLNSFQADKHPNTPTIRGLVTTLEHVVKDHSILMVNWDPDLIDLKAPYVYALIEGCRRLWNSDEKPYGEKHKAIGWLLLKLYYYLSSEEFWESHGAEGDGWTPDANWIPSAVAELISDGTRADETAFGLELNATCLDIIKILLDRLDPKSDTESSDALTRAINSERGKVIQSIILLALRECRLADKDMGSHEEVWNKFEVYFDREIDRAEHFHHDILPLLGDYLANFYYLSKEWPKSAMTRIGMHDQALVAFFHGFSYGRPVKEGILDLESLGLIDQVLKSVGLERDFRERIWERVALASLHRDIDIIEKASQDWTNADDLRSIIDLYGRVHDDQLTKEQKEVVFNYWSWVLEHLNQFEKLRAADLAPLLKYIDDLDEHTKRFVVPVLGDIRNDNQDLEVIRFLNRQIDKSPDMIADLMNDLFDHWTPTWDMDSLILTMIRKLMEDQSTRVRALELCGKLEDLPGVSELYEEYRSN